MNSKNVLCIGGMDPCGGAGLLADIKTLHQCGVQGFGVTTAITFQHDEAFLGLQWVSREDILEQIKPLLERPYEINAVKVGIVSDWPLLTDVLKQIHQVFPEVPVVWDPVLKASAGYSFHQSHEKETLTELIKRVSVITPNLPEAEVLSKELGLRHLSDQPNLNVVIKGGHDSGEHSFDTLYQTGQPPMIFQMPRIKGSGIHGSGCVFASALAAGLAKGDDLASSTRQAKEYVHQLMQTTKTPLAIHHFMNND